MGNELVVRNSFARSGERPSVFASVSRSHRASSDSIGSAGGWGFLTRAGRTRSPSGPLLIAALVRTTPAILTLARTFLHRPARKTFLRGLARGAEGDRDA